MQTPFGPSKRGKTLLAAAAGLLTLVLIAGASITLNPGLRTRVTGSLLGATNDLVPRGMSEWDDESQYYLHPLYSPTKCLTGDVTYYGQYGFYTILYDCSDQASSRWYVARYNQPDRFIITMYKPSHFHPDRNHMHKLNVAGASESAGADVILWNSWQTATDEHEQWRLLTVKDDLYLIQNAKSNMCLTVRDRSETNGAGITQVPCNGEDWYQVWWIQDAAQ